MGDLYSEYLVKKKPTALDAVIKYGLIILTVLAALAGLFVSPVILVLAVILGVVSYLVIPKTDIEYEYLFVNGELDIDMVMAKTKRKKVNTFDLREADLIAPVNSQRMAYYNNNSKLKILDYSSGDESHRRFAVIIGADGDTCKVILEPDDTMAQAIKNSAPSKVFLD